MKTLFSLVLVAMSMTAVSTSFAQEPVKPAKPIQTKKPAGKVVKATKKAKQQPVKQ